MRLEDELENLKTDYTEREGQIAYLKDKIDKLEAEQPDQLISGTKKNLFYKFFFINFFFM